MPSMFLLALVAACLFPLCGARYYTNYTSSWLVKVEGGEEVADVVAAKFNLINRGQVRGEEEEGETSRGYKLASGEGLVVFTAAATVFHTIRLDF